jgi:predicted anti-sigma-YlaC factor YlaD
VLHSGSNTLTPTPASFFSNFSGAAGRLSQSFGAVLLVLLLTGCSARHLIVQSLGDELASQGQAVEEDVGLAREASAFYLKLSESLLRESPGSLKLAESVCAGLSQYAFAFVAFEAEKLAASDAQGAHRINERAKRLYLRAHRHAMLAMELSSPGFAAQLAQPKAGQWPALSKDQIGLAYWAAASWGGYISLSKDVPDAVADLPLAYRLAGLAWKLDPQYGDGGLASLMGSFESAVPGGSMDKAAQYFDAAIAMSGGKNAGPFVAKAENIALAQGQRDAFEMLLQKAMEASELRRDLPNEVMRERAQWLLKTADDLF